MGIERKFRWIAGAEISGRPNSTRSAPWLRRRRSWWGIFAHVPGARVCFLFAVSLMLGIVPGGALRAQTALRPLSLAEAIRIALDQSPDLETAEHRTNAAHAAIDQTEAAFYPQVRMSGGYAATNDSVQAFMMTLGQRDFDPTANFNHPSTTDNLNIRFKAIYSIYNGGRDRAGREAALATSEAQQQQLAATQNALVLEVTRAFHTIRKARRLVEVERAATASMEANLAVAQSRFEQGLALKSDVLDAEVRLAEAREREVRAQTALARSNTLFRSVLGVGEGERVTASEAADDTELDDLAQQQAAADALQDAAQPLEVSRRPEWQAAQRAVEALEQEVRVAFGGYLPRVDAFANYDLNSGLGNDFEDSWIAGVNIEVDLFDGFLTHSRVHESRARVLESRAWLRRVLLDLQAEARQAQLGVREAAARLATSTRSVAQAQESLEIAKDRYAGGLALLTQVLDAETALSAARQRRIAARADYRIMRASLGWALGQPWAEWQ
jgi:outer membrane protein TolC